MTKQRRKTSPTPIEETVGALPPVTELLDGSVAVGVNEVNYELVASLAGEMNRNIQMYPGYTMYRQPKLGVPVGSGAYYESVRLSRDYYKEESFVRRQIRNIINKAYSQGCAFQADDDNHVQDLNYWASQVNFPVNKNGGLDTLSRQILRHLLLEEQVIIAHQMGPMKSADGKNQWQMPMVVECLNPTKIVPDCDTNGKRIWWYKLSDKQTNKKSMQNVIANFFGQQSIQIKNGLENFWGNAYGGSFFQLPSDNITVISIDQFDDEEFPVPLIESLFASVAQLRLLRMADWQIAHSIVNYILVIKFPVQVQKPERDSFVNAIQAGRRTQMAGIPEGVTFETVQVDTATLLNKDKYSQPSADLRDGFGFFQGVEQNLELAKFAIEGMDNEAIALQLFLKRTIECLLEKIWKKNGWELPVANLVLAPIGMKQDVALALYILGLQGRGTTLRVHGYNPKDTLTELKLEKQQKLDEKFPIRPSFSQAVSKLPGGSKIPNLPQPNQMNPQPTEIKQTNIPSTRAAQLAEEIIAEALGDDWVPAWLNDTSDEIGGSE